MNYRPGYSYVVDALLTTLWNILVWGVGFYAILVEHRSWGWLGLSMLLSASLDKPTKS